jgi:16S rRNA (uracil1498-N3)-methyltransferase
VTVKLLRVPVISLAEGELTLDEPTSRYVAKVHRLGPGITFLAFDPVQGLETEALITEVGRRVSCRAGALRAASRRRPLDVTLIYALAKGEKVELVVRDATALGASRVVLVHSERSVVRLDPARAAQRLKRLTAVAVESARQCGRGDLPAIEGPVAIDAALSCYGEGLPLILDAGSDRPLYRALRAWTAGSKVQLAVGPEGGFTPAELDTAARHGWTAVCLGPLTLRTETAAVAALAALLARAEDEA